MKERAKKKLPKRKLPTVHYRGHYIHGKFQFSGEKTDSPSSFKVHLSPADLDDIILKTPKKESANLNKAFQSGEKAYLPWTRLSLKERVKRLAPIKQIIQKHQKELSLIIARETGKPLKESEGEVGALIRKTHFVLGEGLKRIQEKILPQGGRIRFKSRGILIIIGPFNFPMHLPFGQILPALVSGNTVIFKASEKTQASGQKLAECFHQLKLPPGVFQMIQGGPGISKKLCSHKKGAGVLFTGSFEVGQKIKESLVKDPFKILALEMGGWNTTLIWDNSKKKKAVEACLKGCFLSTGQRCSSTSQIILHKKIAGAFIKDLCSQAQKIKVDHWSKNPFMGPLIDKNSVQRFLNFEKEVLKKGGEILLEGKKLHKNPKGFYVSPGIYKMKFDKNSSLGKKEIFSPQVIIYETESLNEAIDMINHSGFGLSLSVFSQNPALREEIFHRAKVGLINYDLSTVGASPLLPFGGLGKSGNDRPAGAFTIDSCVSPLAEKKEGGF